MAIDPAGPSRANRTYVNAYDRVSTDGGATFTTDADGIVAVSGTTTYTSKPILLSLAAGISPSFHLVMTGTMTGTFQVEGTNYSDAAIAAATAGWVKFTSAPTVQGGTAITFTSGDGAIASAVDTLMAGGAMLNYRAVRFKYTNATNSGTLAVYVGIATV